MYNNIVILIFRHEVLRPWFYISISIILGVILKDNRALCKYFCPVAVLQKIFMPFAILRMKISNERCTECKLCELNCQMDIELMKYKKENLKVMSSDCIQCRKCIDVCPRNAIFTSIGKKIGN